MEYEDSERAHKKDLCLDLKKWRVFLETIGRISGSVLDLIENDSDGCCDILKKNPFLFDKEFKDRVIEMRDLLPRKKGQWEFLKQSESAMFLQVLVCTSETKAVCYAKSCSVVANDNVSTHKDINKRQFRILPIKLDLQSNEKLTSKTVLPIFHKLAKRDDYENTVNFVDFESTKFSTFSPLYKTVFDSKMSGCVEKSDSEAAGIIQHNLINDDTGPSFTPIAVGFGKNRGMVLGGFVMPHNCRAFAWLLVSGYFAVRPGNKDGIGVDIEVVKKKSSDVCGEERFQIVAFGDKNQQIKLFRPEPLFETYALAKKFLTIKDEIFTGNIQFGTGQGDNATVKKDGFGIEDFRHCFREFMPKELTDNLQVPEERRKCEKSIVKISLPTDARKFDEEAVRLQILSKN